MPSSNATCPLNHQFISPRDAVFRTIHIHRQVCNCYFLKLPNMQSIRTEQNPTKPQGGGTAQTLRDKKVSDLIIDNRRRLVEVPYTASLADTMNALLANRISAVPVAAPPGHWIGAGGSMILESDKQTGAARKHYIGMVTMMDVVAQIAGCGEDLERQMHVAVSSIIGHCPESLSLWTLNCNTSIQDCMEAFSKGVHRALVPVDSHTQNIVGVELVESASTYRMLTQMDLLRFLKGHEQELRDIFVRPIKELGAICDIILGVTDKTTVIDTIRCMNGASLTAVPVVESSPADDQGQIIDGKGRKLVGTFSATDLRVCPISVLHSCLHLKVLEFITKLAKMPQHEASGLRNPTEELITCRSESPLGEVMDEVVNNHVHRVWVVDESGCLSGVISLTDIIQATRLWML